MTTPTTETGIVEKVARAIHDARFEGIAPEYRPHPTRDYSDHEYATRLARAATAAMPDLTDLPRLLELQRTAAPDCPKEEGWNAALERAAEIVRSALGETPRLPDSTQLLQTMAGALEQIESGAKLGSELFKARIEERKDRLTWYAVNVLQHNLDACQGTAEIALAQFRAEQRS